jgi:NAD(P)H-binding
MRRTEVEFVAFPKVINEVSINRGPSLLSTMAAESMINPTATPFRFFLLGATGRTGLPFLAQALDRGHVVTIFVRDLSRLPVALASHPRLRTVTGELHESDKMARAMGEANPDVVVVMLASETAPYTAVSTGTHSALRAITAVKPNPMPFISIAAWGLGPTGDYITGFFTRTLVGIAKRLFWSKPHADFEKQLAEIEEARNEGLIRPILILPPLLNNREKTDTYLSGEASTIKDAMSVTSFVSRASMADLCLRLGEKAASGEEVPQWVGITNP